MCQLIFCVICHYNDNHILTNVIANYDKFSLEYIILVTFRENNGNKNGGTKTEDLMTSCNVTTP